MDYRAQLIPSSSPSILRIPAKGYPTIHDVLTDHIYCLSRMRSSIQQSRYQRFTSTKEMVYVYIYV